MFEFFEILGDIVFDALNTIWELLRPIWDSIQKTYKRLFRFSTDVVKWLTKPSHVARLKSEEGAVAVVIKERLASGDFNVVKCLCNPSEEEVYDAEVVETESLDAETLRHFGDDDVLVLGYEG